MALDVTMNRTMLYDCIVNTTTDDHDNIYKQMIMIILINDRNSNSNTYGISPRWDI